MTDKREQPGRSWQEIAAEASKETDPKSLVDLIKELEGALDARDQEQKAVRKAAPRARTPVGDVSADSPKFPASREAALCLEKQRIGASKRRREIGRLSRGVALDHVQFQLTTAA